MLTYKDSPRKLGADREYTFTGKSFETALPLLQAQMKDRLIAAVGTTPTNTQWQLRVKHLSGLNAGTEGTLRFGESTLSYTTDAKRHSRTWNLSDIENISSSGPFELTLSTYERSKTHYNSYRAFHFQLKDRIDEGRLQQYWLRLNGPRIASKRSGE